MRRRLLALAAAAVAVVGGGAIAITDAHGPSPAKPAGHLWVTPIAPTQHQPQIEAPHRVRPPAARRHRPRSVNGTKYSLSSAPCISTDCGPYAAALHYSLAPWGHTTTGYYIYLNNTALGAQVDNTTEPQYVIGGGDCGVSITLGVRQHDNGGNVGPLYTSGYTTPNCTTTLVGTAGSPTPSCTATVSVNGNVDSALTSGGANAVVCLASGSWNEIDLTSTHTATNATLRAATPGGAIVNGLRITGSTANLTIEGLKMTQGFYIEASANGDTLRYNTSEGWGNSSMDAQTNSAYFVCPSCGAGGSTTNLQILYNQIDTVPQCLQDDGNGNTTFSHNVCGPTIGNGGEADVHYTQEDGVNGDTLNNNAFLGPIGAGASGHPNVAHMAGSNDTFDNNILWHVDGFQHLQMNDDFASTNLEVSNNLDVEDPSETNGAFEQIASNFSLSGFAQATNTVIGASGETAADYTIEGSPTSCATSDNIGVGNAGNGNFVVAAGCTSSGNVSSDTTAPGTGAVHSWTPSWQNTTWTPNTGSPWSPPPTGYYVPNGGGITQAGGYGYQGTINGSNPAIGP